MLRVQPVRLAFEGTGKHAVADRHCAVDIQGFFYAATPRQPRALRQPEGTCGTRLDLERRVLRLSVILDGQTNDSHLWSFLADTMGRSGRAKVGQSIFQL